jgi:hypothetical protein
MKTKFMLTGFAAMVAVACAIPNQSHAALNTCPEPGFSTEPNAKVENAAGNLTATSACQYVTPPDQSTVANLTNINAAGFFGITNWQDNGQTQTGSGGASGTWSISNVDFAAFDYIIVFKDGADTNLIAFLFNEQFSSGVWSTPFTEPPFDLSGGSTVHDVSHYSIVRTPGGSTPVPEPASLGLLGMGLLGLGLLGRRRRS